MPEPNWRDSPWVNEGGMVLGFDCSAVRRWRSFRNPRPICLGQSRMASRRRVPRAVTPEELTPGLVRSQTADVQGLGDHHAVRLGCNPFACRKGTDAERFARAEVPAELVAWPHPLDAPATADPLQSRAWRPGSVRSRSRSCSPRASSKAVTAADAATTAGWWPAASTRSTRAACSTAATPPRARPAAGACSSTARSATEGPDHAVAAARLERIAKWAPRDRGGGRCSSATWRASRPSAST